MSLFVKPLVSIVIPCFNSEAFVRQAIESCLNQSYANREVIVVDDGSTDSSTQVLESFGRAIRYESGPNRGGCFARNRGVELATGDWVQFLDADDLLHPDKLEKQVPVSLLNPESIVYCDHQVVSIDGTSVKRSCAVKWSDPIEFVMEHMGLTTIAPLHRKQWLQKVGGFRVGLRAAQEFDLHLRLAATGIKFHHLPESLFTVRRQAVSVSSNPAKTAERWIDFMPDLLESLERSGSLNDHRRNFLAKHIATTARLVLRHGNRAVGEKLMQLAADIDRTAANLAYGTVSRFLKAIIGSYRVEKLGRLRKTTH